MNSHEYIRLVRSDLYGVRNKRVIRIFAVSLLLLCVILSAACRPGKAESKFGMDISELKPLIVTVHDHVTGEVSFSRDPSNISSAVHLFENMVLTAAEDATDTVGLEFTVATMYGDFLLGEFFGKRIRIDGVEYILEKDYTTDFRLLSERIQAETRNIKDVPYEKIMAIEPLMTYRQLLDSFGTTLETSISSNKIAYLYKYGEHPFYVSYEKEQDSVIFSGKTLLKAIWSDYNLGDSLIPPTQLPGGMLDTYKSALGELIDLYLTQSTGKPDVILVDTLRLARLDNEERSLLAEWLEGRYEIAVEDTENAILYQYDEYVDGNETTELAVWVTAYTYIGSDSIAFSISGRMEGSDPLKIKAGTPVT